MPDIFTSPGIGDIQERYRQENVDAAFQAAQREIESRSAILKQMGIEPPTDDSPGFLEKFFDVLDTGGQYIRGGLASTFNVPGYGHLPIGEAAAKGTKENLTVGEMFRKSGTLTDSPTLRAGLGFVGDVATDPLNYLTLGGGLGARVGGKVVTSAGREVFETALEKGLKSGKSRELLIGVAKKLKNEVIGAEEATHLSRKITSQAEVLASKPFRDARALLEQKKKFIFDKPIEEIKAPMMEKFAAQERRIRDALDLPDTMALEDLFEKNAIRATGLFPDLGTGFAHIPLFNTARKADIPIVTDLSKDVFQFLEGPLYNAKVNVGKGLDAAYKAGQAIGGPFAWAASMMQAVRKFPHLLSKTVQAGGKAKFEFLQEHDAARLALASDVNAQRALMFKKFSSLGGTEEDLELIGQTLESGIRYASQAKRPKGVKAADISILEDPTVLNRSIAKVKDYLNAKNSGLGDEAARLMDRIRGDFESYADIEGREGVLSSVIEGYVPHMYELPKGISDAARNDFSKTFAKGVPRFTLPRTIASFSEAMSKGLKPNTNIGDLWYYRTFHHNRAMVEKEFIERMGLEFGIPKDTYEKIKLLVASKNVAISKGALSFLSKMDINPNDAIEQAIKGSSEGLPALKIAGQPLDVKTYDKLKQAMMLEPDVNDPARKLVEQLGLTFSDKERQTIETFSSHLDEYRKGLLGRAGETVVSRAGASMPYEKFRTFIAKNKDMAEDDKNWFLGVLPDSFVHALNESMDTRGTLQRLSKLIKSKGDSEGAEALDRFAGGALGYLKNLKLGATIFWPAYHLRNLASAQMMGVKEASALGEAFNPLKMIETYWLRKGKLNGLVQKGTNRFISAKQLESEAANFGWRNENPLHAIDVINHQADYLNAVVNKIGADPKHGKSFWERSKQGLFDFSNFIENYGREHLYYQLRRTGHDPVSAANSVNQIMVNYAKGKTQIERDFLNNIFFFYSFARAETANTITALVTRPGALTAQLHAVEGVKELLMDPNAVPLPEGMEEKFKTLRGKETLSRFIGRTESGSPLMLQGFGVPIEETARYLNLRAPKDLTVQSIVDAVGEGVVRTGQTVLAQTNPILRAPLEMIFNKNLFYNRPLDDISLRKVPKWERDLPGLIGYACSAVPKWVWEGLDIVTQKTLKGVDNGDGTYTVNPIRLSILQSFVPGASRFLSTRAALLKPGFTDPQKFMRTLSGVKPVEIDPEKAEVFRQRDELRDFIIKEALPRSKRELAQRQKLTQMMMEEK